MDKEKVFTLEGVDYFLDRIFLEYEQPELFSVSNEADGIFIVMLVDEVSEKWLMTPISASRLCKLEYGAISIREVFVHPEIKKVQLVEIDGEDYSVSYMVPEEIGEDYLPLEDARLNWDNIPMPQINEQLYEIARRRHRDIFDIRVDSGQTKDHTIKSKDLGLLLIILQDGIFSFAKNRNKNLGIKKGLTAGCTLRYAGSYPGSFGLRLESEEMCNLLGETNLTPVLNELFTFLQINNLDILSQMVKNYSFDCSKSLRKLLKFSCDNEASLDFAYATPLYKNQGKVVWKKENTRATLEYLDRLIKDEVKDEVYVGDLITIIKKQNKFGFITENGDEINGEIDPSLKERKFTVKSHAKIFVKKSIKITNLNETVEKYSLVGIEELDN